MKNTSLKNKITRIEVVDWTPNSNGMVFLKTGKNLNIDIDIQDNNKTIKIFVKEITNKENIKDEEKM